MFEFNKDIAFAISVVDKPALYILSIQVANEGFNSCTWFRNSLNTPLEFASALAVSPPADLKLSVIKLRFAGVVAATFNNSVAISLIADALSELATPCWVTPPLVGNCKPPFFKLVSFVS